MYVDQYDKHGQAIAPGAVIRDDRDEVGTVVETPEDGIIAVSYATGSTAERIAGQCELLLDPYEAAARGEV